MPATKTPDDDGRNSDGLEGIDRDLAASFRALRALVVASQQLRSAFADHLGVSITDTFAMGHLAGSTPRTARDLAQHLGVAQSSVTAVIDRLERAGLAERRPHPTDRRALIVALTDDGRAAVADIRRWTINALEGFDRKRLPALTRDLDRLAAGLATQAGEFTAENPPHR